MIDEQRALIRFIFATLTVDEGKLSYTYSKTFKILSEAVSETNGPKVEKIDDLENGKFELTKKPDNSTQKDALLPLRPIWLPRVDSNHGPIAYKNPSSFHEAWTILLTKLLIWSLGA